MEQTTPKQVAAHERAYPGGRFKVIRLDRTLRGSEQALRYAAFRSEDVKGRELNIFDDRTNSADVQAFARSLDDRVSRHHSAAKAYHTLFSLKRPDFERAGMDDWREVVRESDAGVRAGDKPSPALDCHQP